MTAGSEGFLPYGRQLIEADDVAAVTAALMSDWLTTGPLVARFETALAHVTGGRHAVACANGTAALHLAMLALGLKQGDAVIVPSLTFLATANAPRFVGAEVVFADVDADTGMLGPDHLEGALRRVPSGLVPRAVIPVHLRGAVCDMDALYEVAERHGLAIVEDAAHAIGSMGASQAGAFAVGSYPGSAMACFSFHPVKTIAMGEGGAVTTNEPVYNERLRRLRSHGMVHAPERWADAGLGFEGGEPNPWYYEMPEPGYNYRLTDIQCALGVSQLAKLDRFAARRRDLAGLYDRLIAGLGRNAIRPHAFTPDMGQPAWHLYSARIDFAGLGLARGEVMRRLKGAGIGTQVHYIPVHRQPYYRARYGELDLPGADRYYARTLSLPLFAGVTDDDAARVVAALNDVTKAP